MPPTSEAPNGLAAPPPAFAGMSELTADAVVAEVLARNPSLAQMVASWQAAQARYPQVTSLDDPMVAATVGPGTLFPDDPGINFAYRLEVSQKYPWPGKLQLKGANARAEANAAGADVEDMRLQLTDSARSAFYDYYLVERALAVNADGLRLLRKFRAIAADRYDSRLAPQQDKRQADVEIGKQEERQLTLQGTREIAVARLNTLLNRPPDALLPPPPEEIHLDGGLPDAAALRALALARRPDLKALEAHIAAEEAALALAHKEYCPDLEAFFMYDRFMGNNAQSKDLASMAGVRLNLPVRLCRRDGAVAEAEARVGQRRAELASRANQASFEVQQGHAQVRESERIVRLYEKTILPAAKANVEAARSAYETNLVPFLSLVEAQRNAIMLRDRYYEAVADYFRRRASLERAVGGSLAPPPVAESPPA